MKKSEGLYLIRDESEGLGTGKGTIDFVDWNDRP
jgi:hypothetical protein